MIKDNFTRSKEEAMKKLERARVAKEVDDKILPILDIINSLDNYYTSSSCAGRILLIQIPSIGDKKNAVFLGKWHREIEGREIIDTVKKSEKGFIWILAQSPIIHICAKTLDDGDKMVKLGNRSGFKNSSLKSVKGRIVVEIASTERLDAPIGKNGKIFCNKELLNLLVRIANDVLKRSDKKLERLKEELNKI